MSDPTAPPRGETATGKPGDPVVYHLDDGDTAPGIFLGWKPGIGPKTADLRVLFMGEMAAKYMDRDGWFSKHYMESWKHCVPECCDLGTEPGEFEFASAPSQMHGGYNTLNIVLHEAVERFNLAANGAELERDEYHQRGSDSWVELNSNAARYRWLAGEAQALRDGPSPRGERAATEGPPPHEGLGDTPTPAPRALTIYTASRTRHAHKWRMLRDAGHRVIATWIDEAGPGDSPDLADLSRRCVEEAARADITILYVEPDDHIKGALIEVGAALGNGKPVYCIGDCPSISPTFTKHPLWHAANNAESAIAHALSRAAAEPATAPAATPPVTPDAAALLSSLAAAEARVADYEEQMSEIVAPKVGEHEWTEELPDGSRVPVMRGSPKLSAFIWKLHDMLRDYESRLDAAGLLPPPAAQPETTGGAEPAKDEPETNNTKGA